MTYPAIKQYLNSLANYEKNTSYSYQKALKLQRLRNFLKILGDPQKSLRIIHVAGSKGKGSTCAMVAYILREAGFRVGLYTSPHLKDFRERVRILCPYSGASAKKYADFEGMISRGVLTDLVQELKLRINKYNCNLRQGQLSFFEVYTALAFLYFKRSQVDFVVLETGMGGRLDATNTADALVCGISSLSFEHVQKLGKTLSKIAAEKAGIIKKKGAIVISAPQALKAQKIIRKRCKIFQARLYEVGKQIQYSGSQKKLEIKGIKNNYQNLQLNLFGQHQLINAAVAVGLVEGLSFYGVDIAPRAIRAGLGNTIWPGRCELIQSSPLTILDGAQNLASAQALKKTIQDNFKYRELILVLGISSDKDIQGICKTLNPLADKIILTRASTARAADPAELAGYCNKKLYLTQSVKEAKLLARSLADRRDLILVTGSLFVVGEFRDAAK